MNWKCVLGLHKFEWPEHDRPFVLWTYLLWCQRGCGNFVMRECHRYEHDAQHHPEPVYPHNGPTPPFDLVAS